ncbi:alpha/beta hydrolase [Microbulbifer bruguierae]|uniref:Alpha/beta hydrolase n=1 Tax=Microbulbifer bruguierae TaxID=3029061 RepID=A0ABY8NF81_9GAMM|nr:alpha/beta hydrolase [Microbulbifer bruguierae]WGL17591.1 alpha/beta hydrolase [Microbulbifer bruguierae]
MNRKDNLKPPVLLIHGMWGTAEAMREVGAAFSAEGYVVEALTLPHHAAKCGYDTAARARLARTRLQDYVDFIIARIKTLDAAPILVGHSMGALLAQLVAARVPCERLVLLSSAAPGGINSWSWSMIRTLGRNLLLFPMWLRVTELRADNIRYGVANSQSAATQQQILDMSTYESGMATFQIGVGGLLPGGFSRLDTRAIQCPILIIGGSEDRITPPGIQRRIAALYGGRARLVEIPGACHWTIGGTHFPEVRAAIFGWLASD